MNIFVKTYYSIRGLVGLLLLKILAPFEKFTRPIFWLEQIPHNIRPNERKCEELENLRIHYSCPNETFLHIVLSSPAVTRKVQENVYYDAKKQMPNASEKMLLEAVLRSRLYPQHPFGLQISEQGVQEAMRSINSLDDLKEYIVSVDKREHLFLRDKFGVGGEIAKKVDEILESYYFRFRSAESHGSGK